jgi:dipeptidyl aminopeptidase/acylaminoacyl peptidase
MTTKLKPGSWPSPLSAATLASASTKIAFTQVVEDDLWWDESRPQENGRKVVVSRKHGDILKAPFSAVSQAHEYGGLSWLGFQYDGETMLAFVNKADQRIYVAQPKGDPVPWTPKAPEGEIHRYIEMISSGDEIWCIRELHRNGKVERAIVAVSPGTVREIESSSHFYSSPRVSPDGKHLAWIAWEHPQMPWDGTELRVADIHEGVLSNLRILAGSIEESCLMPVWGSESELYYLSDKSGWWNLWSTNLLGECRHVIDDRSEWGTPLWVLGLQTISLVDNGKLLVLHGVGDHSTLSIVDPAARTMREIPTEYSSFYPFISSGNGYAYAVGSSHKVIQDLIEIDLKNAMVKEVIAGTTLPIDGEFFGAIQPITALRDDGRPVYAYLHAAHHPDYTPTEKTPLIVVVHGGPTSATTNSLHLDYSYFTTRGIAVVDIDYGGSTGYGRHYRNLLRGQWGIVDREDVIAVVESLVKSGDIDPKKVLIRGGSAGGFTVLNVLVNSDVFAAGASYYGVADCAALALETHDFESRYLDSMIGAYPEEADVYTERSPLTHADRLSSPLIIFQGLDDKIVLPAQSEAFRDVCVDKGIKHRYIAYEGEGHGFRKASSIIDAIESEMTFYGEVLGFSPRT